MSARLDAGVAELRPAARSQARGLATLGRRAPAHRDRARLLQDPKLLILDEPTSVLTPQEADQLFVVLERLQGRRPRDPLHQPQARRGEAALRHRHDPARRQDGRDLRSAGGDRGLAGAHDGRRRDQGSEGRRRPRKTTVPRLVVNDLCLEPDDPHGVRLNDISLRAAAAAKSWASPASPATARTNCSPRCPASGCARIPAPS